MNVYVKMKKEKVVNFKAADCWWSAILRGRKCDFKIIHSFLIFILIRKIKKINENFE